MDDVIIFGCGDIGRRVGTLYIEDGATVTGVVRTRDSTEAPGTGRIVPFIADLDALNPRIPDCSGKALFHMVPPAHGSDRDLRSRMLISCLGAGHPRKVVLISTTGVYGDCRGEWVDENRPAAPLTDRARRRLDAETQWSDWAKANEIPLTVLRIPGIYSRSRIPRERLESGEPVVAPGECGWTNRIHADDLARICVAAMVRASGVSIINISDGRPGTISDYLIAAARELGLAAPPVISLSEADDRLSPGMLSYLAESRRIDNGKMLRDLEISLLYQELGEGLKH